MHLWNAGKRQEKQETRGDGAAAPQLQRLRHERALEPERAAPGRGHRVDGDTSLKSAPAGDRALLPKPEPARTQLGKLPLPPHARGTRTA